MSNNQQISFQGRVIDQDKQAPLRGIKVSLDFSGAPPVVYTDLEGIYKFKVNFRDSSTIKGQLTIEAKGYNTHNSRIELSPKHKDLGDLQLGTTHITSSTSNSSNNNSINTSSTNNIATSSSKDSSTSKSTSISKNSIPSSNSNRNSNSNSQNNTVDRNNVLMPLMVATMIAFALIIAALTQPSNQENPLKTREKRINSYHQNHTRILNDP